MEEVARVYSEALFEVAKSHGKLDQVHEQLGQVAEALADDGELQLFFFSPYFSSEEKRDGVSKTLSGAEPDLLAFLELLAEKHRMPAVFRVRRRFDELWAKERGHLEVTARSAIELDPEVVRSIGAEIERKTGQTIELSSEVDQDLIGGIVLQVGNMVLDASIQNRLEKLRKEVAQAA